MLRCALGIIVNISYSNQGIINGYVIPHKDVKAFVDRLSDIVKNHENYKRVYEESYKTFIEELSFPVWRKRIHSVITLLSKEIFSDMI